MDTQQAFALALRTTRKSRNLTQEDFSEVSSRTYISTLERGLKNPTIEKIDALASTIGIHPLTLLALTYLYAGEGKPPDELIGLVTRELVVFL